MSIKLIGLDLDRTTLNNKRQITPRTVKAIEKASGNGVHVVIATGRSFYSMPPAVYDIDGLEYTVNSNGAEIRKLHTKEVVYKNFIDKEGAIKVIEILKTKEFMLEAFVDGRAYISEADFYDVANDIKFYRAKEYIINTRKPVKDIIAFMEEHSDELENINIFFENDQDKMATWEEFKEIPNITVTSSMANNIEIGGKTTSKAEALTHFAKALGVKKEEMMCCGDSPNDIAMMKTAGLAIAMANAEVSVKEIADFVTDTNDNDGVAKAIEKFVLI